MVMLVHCLSVALHCQPGGGMLQLNPDQPFKQAHRFDTALLFVKNLNVPSTHTPRNGPPQACGLSLSQAFSQKVPDWPFRVSHLHCPEPEIPF